MATKPKPDQPATLAPIDELNAWLTERGWALLPVVIGPTGETLSVAAAMKRELREDGWQPGHRLVRRDGDAA